MNPTAAPSLSWSQDLALGHAVLDQTHREFIDLLPLTMNLPLPLPLPLPQTLYHPPLPLALTLFFPLLLKNTLLFLHSHLQLVKLIKLRLDIQEPRSRKRCQILPSRSPQ